MRTLAELNRWRSALRSAALDLAHATDDCDGVEEAEIELERAAVRYVRALQIYVEAKNNQDRSVKS